LSVRDQYIYSCFLKTLFQKAAIFILFSLTNLLTALIIVGINTTVNRFVVIIPTLAVYTTMILTLILTLVILNNLEG